MKIDNFAKRYATHEVKLKRMEFHGRITILRGINGSGKSTLIKAIVGLIHHEGTILHDLRVSYMPEHHSLPSDVLVIDFLDAMRLVTGTDYHNLVSEFGLAPKLNQQIGHLSKGMKGKLNLLQCLMEDADLYLLDEPTNGLDAEGMMKLLQHIKKSTKRFLIATHNIERLNIANAEIFDLI